MRIGLQKHTHLAKRLMFNSLALLGFALFANVQQAKATHVMGADITYKCIDTLKFEFIIKYYRYCGGVPFGNPSNITKLICTKTGASQGVSLSRTSIRDVTPVCATATKPCNPSNTSRTGDGIEEHYYTVTIDFNKAPYSNLTKNGCCEVRLQTGQCCRNSNITSGAANQNFYTYATIDLCKAPCNSSPALTTEPIAYLCCNQPFYYNNGASDTANFDSLSYSFANPLRGWNNKISYSGNYTYKNPFDSYYPGSLKPPYNNPNANPPIGIYLDPETGDLIFTPVKCDEITVAVLEVKEWRKNATTGKYEVIGVTRRDMQFITKQCPGNNPPIIKGKFSTTVCEGTQICYTVTTEDKIKVPPPPLPKPDPDTVTIKWNRGIPGATFTIVNAKALNQSGRFCWTPPIGSASDLPYTYTVTARDDACPLNAVTVRAFQVKVNPIAEAKRIITKLDCGRYAIESDPFPNFKNPAKYAWQLKDSNGVIIFDRKVGYLESTGSFISSKQFDTILFRTGGTYIIQHTINNSPKCPNDYYDTIVVPPLLEVDLAFGPDTFVCARTTLRLEPNVKNGSLPVTYLWGTGDTTSYIDISVPNRTSDTTFYVEITDQNNCVAWDSTTVFLKENPLVKIGPDRRICTYNTISLFPNDSLAYWDDPRDTAEIKIRQGDTLYKEWFLDGTLISQDTALIDINIGGEYVIKVIDSIGCFATDTMILAVNDTVVANAGIDRTFCWDDFMELIGTELDTAGNWKTGTFRWWDITANPKVNMGTKDTLAYNIQNSTDFQLELFITEDTTTCYDADTVIITVNPLPIVDMPSDMEVCHDAGKINLRIVEDPNAAGGVWFCPAKPALIENSYEFITEDAGHETNSTYNQVYYSYVDPSTGCVKTDSFEIKVNPLPKVELRDGYFCQDKETVNVKNDQIIKLPGGGTLALGRQAWKCLDCGNYKESDIIEDINGGGPGATQDYVLHIDTLAIPLGSKTSDTITIEFEFRNVFGCYNRDTADIAITKVPKIAFKPFDDLCWDAGIKDLKVLSEVTPYDGIWRAVDSSGFEAASDFNVAVKSDTFNGDTLNTFLTPEPAEGTGLTYMMEYYHDRSGCPTSRKTPLTIRGLPVPIIDEIPFSEVHTSTEPFTFCELDENVNMEVNYGGGNWSSDESSALSGADFVPSAISNYNAPFHIYYDFTDIYGCEGRDSVQVVVHQQHTLEISNDTAICRTDNMVLDVKADYTNATGVSWFALSGSLADGTADQTTYSFRNAPDSVYRHILVAQTVENLNNVCPYTEKTMVVTVHPKPVAEITADTLNGCNPVDVAFTTTIFNSIDPLTSKYIWNYEDGGSDVVQNPSYQYTVDGVNNVTLLLESAFGCDTTLTLDVDVYPIPVAMFTPNPNNSQTAALPKFQFNNESTVTNELGSVISENLWDFGILSEIDDTSTEVSPLFFYPSDTGTYDVTLTVRTQYGCESSFTYPVLIGPDILVFIPNAFSPDGGGPEANDGFRAVVNDAAKEYHLIIFNRWGEVIWETKDRLAEWDGKYGRDAGWDGDPNTSAHDNRLPVAQDVYAYHLRIVSWNDEEFKYSGTVTLIR
jgi:hypothetical protein